MAHQSSSRSCATGPSATERSSDLLKKLRGRAEAIGQVERLAQADGQLEPIALIDGTRVDRTQRFACRGQFRGIGSLTESFEVHPAEDESCAFGEPGLLHRHQRRLFSRVVLPGVIQSASLGQRVGVSNGCGRQRRDQRPGNQLEHAGW